ncbi:hypothetical protein ACTDI4_10905 [Mesorhizobium sp. PUT5]|uniref:hypothetical protein n=1 Tax=Mesorhizobium sp. PUT5 TaxID=3454629 RepID=UPI003FA4A590
MDGRAALSTGPSGMPEAVKRSSSSEAKSCLAPIPMFASLARLSRPTIGFASLKMHVHLSAQFRGPGNLAADAIEAKSIDSFFHEPTPRLPLPEMTDKMPHAGHVDVALHNRHILSI